MAIPRWKWGTETDIITDVGVGDVSGIPSGGIVSRATGFDPSLQPSDERPKEPNIIEEVVKIVFPPYAFVTHPGTQELIEEPENLGTIFPPAAFIGDNPPFWDTATKIKSNIPMGTDITETKEDPTYPTYEITMPDIKMPDITMPEFPDLFGGLTDILGGLSKWILPIAIIVGAFMLRKE